MYFNICFNINGSDMCTYIQVNVFVIFFTDHENKHQVSKLHIITFEMIPHMHYLDDFEKLAIWFTYLWNCPPWCIHYVCLPANVLPPLAKLAAVNSSTSLKAPLFPCVYF